MPQKKLFPVIYYNTRNVNKLLNIYFRPRFGLVNSTNVERKIFSLSSALI